jgi:hypothetical protein
MMADIVAHSQQTCNENVVIFDEEKRHEDGSKRKITGARSLTKPA